MKYYSLSVAYGLITFVIVLISINQQMNSIKKNNEFEIQQWLKESKHKTDSANSASNLMQRFGIFCHYLPILLFN